MAKEVTIKDVRVHPSMDPKRHGKMDAVILFETSGSVQDAVIVPGETATNETIAAAIRAHLASKDGLIGQKFVIE